MQFAHMEEKRTNPRVLMVAKHSLIGSKLAEEKRQRTGEVRSSEKQSGR